MTVQGCDYSDARPSPASLVAAGKVFVARYLEYRGATLSAVEKFLTPPEVSALHGAGLAIVANFESTKDRALGGGAAGTMDGIDARAAVQSLGFPAGCAVYASVDVGLTTSQYPTVLAYFRAFELALSPLYRLGLYGGSVIRGYLVAQGMQHLLFWQSAALSWSGGRWDPTAHIQQRGTGAIAGTDADQALVADYGQWAAPGGDMPIYRKAGPMMTAIVSKGTEFYEGPVASGPVHTIGTTQRFVILADSHDGSLHALGGAVDAPAGSVEVMCGWVPTAALTSIAPLIPTLADYHIDIDVQAPGVPVATVTRA